MLNIKDEGIILEKTELEFENQAVLNPGCIEVDGIVHMFYRAVRLGNFSTIGYCQLDRNNNIIYRKDSPLLFPEYDYEKQGLEDPRIIYLEGLYYLFYTAFDGKNALVAYATSSDLKNFTKHGIISPHLPYHTAKNLFKRNTFALLDKYIRSEEESEKWGGTDVLIWDKDGFMFPAKFDERYALIHRIKPSIQITYFTTFSELTTEKFWTEYLSSITTYTVLDPETSEEYIGGGCPPIETSDGWLFIHHRVKKIDEKFYYYAAAVLLDRNDPTKVVGKLKEPFFSPTELWEKVGDVNNVVFPTGAFVRDGRVIIYYGAADKVVAAKSVDLGELLRALKAGYN